jgi:hypothetical protein
MLTYEKFEDNKEVAFRTRELKKGETMIWPKEKGQKDTFF